MLYANSDHSKFDFGQLQILDGGNKHAPLDLVTCAINKWTCIGPCVFYLLSMSKRIRNLKLELNRYDEANTYDWGMINLPRKPNKLPARRVASVVSQKTWKPMASC